MKICLFVYDFPHYKSEQGIKELLAKGFEVGLVLAQSFKELKVPRSKSKVYIDLEARGDLRDICDRWSVPYKVCEHNSDETEAYVTSYGCDLGIILGARILKKNIIDIFKYGIINMHPGDIPDNRGLDNFKWAIYRKQSMVVTGHLIDSEIDKGKILTKKMTALKSSDTIYDFSMRHRMNEFDVMLECIEKLECSDTFDCAFGDGIYNSAFPEDLDCDIDKYFIDYKQDFFN